MKAEFEITPTTYDPTIEWGDEVKVFRGRFPLHATITWDNIVPLWQQERNHDYLRCLTPDNFQVHENPIDYEGETDNPDLALEIDRQVLIPTFITHTQDFLDPNTVNICQEAYDLNLKNLHIYSNVLAESFLFKSHRDPYSLLIIQCMGMIQYDFEDDSIHQLYPGDAIYIPRGIYHAPKIFGPRVTFSYNWHYKR
jgi:hypothetical protein